MNLGTSERVDELLAGYPGLFGGLFANETDALLAALLIEQQSDRLGADPTIGVDRSPDDVGGTYHSESASITTDWHHIEPGFVSAEIDLRFDGAIEVAYTESRPNDPEDVIQYASGDSPVAGTPIRTGNVWVRSQSGSVTIDVEVFA